MNVKKLSEIVDLQKGKKPEISSNSDGNLPYLTAKYIRGEADPEYGIPDSKGSVVISHNDYVIIMDGSNSGEVFTELNGILASTMGKLVLKEKINMSYLGYFLDSNKELFSKTKTGSAIPHLSKDIFFNLNIPVPSLQEQEKIVEKLDKLLKNVDEKIGKSQNKVFLFENIIKSYIHKFFNSENPNWKSGVISDFCTLKSGSTINVNLETLDGNLPYLKVADMNISENKKFVCTSSRFVNSENINEKSIIPPGSVIFPKRGGAIFTNKKRLTNVPIIADLNIMSVQPSSVVDPMFLYYYFLNIDMKKLGGGSSIPQINNYDIAPLKFRFPKSIDEQKEIAKKINNLEAIIESLLKK